VIRAACLGLSAALAAVIGLSAFPHTGHSWVSFTFICFCLGYVTCALALQVLLLVLLLVLLYDHESQIQQPVPQRPSVLANPPLAPHHRFPSILIHFTSPPPLPSPQTLNSAIMSIYVCFAEHPASLRVHFPIVHHRFARIAEFSESPGMPSPAMLSPGL